MWELDYKESWIPKNWCFWTVVLENTLESPLDCKEIQLVYPKGNQSWIFTERTDVEAPILWLPDVKNWLIRKDPDAGEDWRQEKGTTQDEMAGWHHWLTDSTDMSLSKFWELVMDRETWGGAVHGVTGTDTTMRLNWTDGGTKTLMYCYWQCKVVQPLWKTVCKFLEKNTPTIFI